jgi:hypothetical protein
MDCVDDTQGFLFFAMFDSPPSPSGLNQPNDLLLADVINWLSAPTFV